MTATQAPTPGPLSGNDMKLLVKLLDTLKPFAEVAEKLKHCHVVEICEPTPDNPSRNIIPMPREWFERAGDDLEYIAIQLHASGVLSEGQTSKITGLDRVSVRREVDRLAPTAPVENPDEPCAPENAIDWATAPVEASGSEREAAGCAEPQVGRAVYERIEKLLTTAPQGWERDYLCHLVESLEEVGGYDGPRLDGRNDRQAVADFLKLRDESVAFHEVDDAERQESADAILALLSARPLALGGQQGVDRGRVEAIVREAVVVASVDVPDKFADRVATRFEITKNATDAIVSALSTTPARAEAQDEGAATRGWDREICTGCSSSLSLSDIKEGGFVSCCPDRRMVKVSDLVDAYEASLRTAHPSPTPAADAACFECASDLWGPVCLNCNPDIRAVVERGPDQHGMAKIHRDQLNDKSRRLNPGNMRPAADAGRVRSEDDVRLLMKSRSAIEAGLATLTSLGATQGGRMSLMRQTSAEITEALKSTAAKEGGE